LELLEGSTVHQQLLPKGWVLANPTESGQQAVYGVYSAGERLIPMESNAIRTSFGPGDRSRNVPHAFAYQDDIIVIGRSLEEHKANLKEVFRRLKEANLRLNPEMCQFLKNELLYLGHRVTSEAIGTDPEKVAAIAELEPPSTVRELRQYLGVASWYRRFVPDFAIIVKPLNDLLRKGISGCGQRNIRRRSKR